MRYMKAAACALLAATLSVTLLTDAVAAEAELTRAQALQRLSEVDASKRREAVARLGDVGVMADSKALVQQLRDSDEEVRSGAEESLWKIWSRSGDEKVDTLYGQGIGQMNRGLATDAVAITHAVRIAAEKAPRRISSPARLELPPPAPRVRR